MSVITLFILRDNGSCIRSYPLFAVIDDDLSELIQRLNTQFPCDVGIFAVFFLNIMKLKPGDAMYLAANIPHAYLFGGEYIIPLTRSPLPPPPLLSKKLYLTMLLLKPTTH